MPIVNEVGFLNSDVTESFLTQAVATNLGGFTINQDFDPEIEDYLRDNTVLWRLIENKKPAPAPIVKKIRKNLRPNVGWTGRSELQNAIVNVHANTALDLNDPGQEVKAIAGIIEFDHFARSMADQQGRPYLDEVAEETDDLLVMCTRFLEQALFTGDAALTGNTQFNGIDKLIPLSNIFTANITGNTPDSLVGKITEIYMRATSDRNYMIKPTHILCSSAGALKIRDEVGQSLLYHNLQEIVAGIKVPGIVSPNGILPIVTSPYINDIDGGTGTDTVRFYIVDLSSIEWNGVFPYGGKKTFDPQIFDITATSNTIPLIEKRMVLLYGCLYAKNSGRGLYRLDVTVPSGTAWSFG